MNRSMIHVQYRDGSRPRGTKVTLGFSAGLTRPAFTDGHGLAIVEHASTGTATVYVGGKGRGSFHAPGTFVVTL